MITAATSAKIAMQIAVTNQKTKSIRAACLLAGSGRQGTSSAGAAAPAPNTTPIATSWTTDPLRTEGETTRRRRRLAEGSAEVAGTLETPATSGVQREPNRVQAGP